MARGHDYRRLMVREILSFPPFVKSSVRLEGQVDGECRRYCVLLESPACKRSPSIFSHKCSQISLFSHKHPNSLRCNDLPKPSERTLAPGRRASRASTCYLAGMKSNERKDHSITGPLLKDLVERGKANSKTVDPDPSVGSQPLAPPALYEDAGEGYNQDFTFPQE
jgi:hypothetical protein